MRTKDENTIVCRHLKLVLYNNQILTMDEYLETLLIELQEVKMDKKIRTIKKKVKKDASSEEKELEQLEKMDKKRDKACDVGAEVLKKRKKK